VWEALRGLRDEGLTRALGVAPGPANGFTLDVIDCFERFGEVIDWAMVILNPLEPWPGELVLPAAREHGVKLITRVVDYGGLFWDDVRPGHAFAERDHRGFRPAGWVEAGGERLERIRPVAERHGLTPMQLACQWNLAHEPVRCVVPTLIQEPGPDARRIEDKRAELAAVPADVVLGAEEVAAIRAIGDNTGRMTLKGASPQFAGEPQADRWPLDGELAELASRWAIDPERDLATQAA
jgi:aryl-alcohol dehydrogenase-like predicted oxidoreductase